MKISLSLCYVTYESLVLESILLTFSVPEKLKNLIFEMPAVPQNLNMKNLRTTSAKSISLNTIRKLIKYLFKNIHCKGNIYSYRFGDIAFRK